ncbi:ABC transporter permease subunit [Kibdelosporangium persicum]|uniref:ABC-type transport system involved in multi-copper enzyme maturation permease subunit n=1 Tax=Kibdelosporangium persicum TaxID=2698649 RepID=A0ABX2EUW6_9PSEU|nr:ABC transporter permease subunit [Kibdelosporangium persicum]NRN62826.1 ABC-type transport system involved in multi-copper enzyme maturation permease subunit [Kibdelosporangium persicum]
MWADIRAEITKQVHRPAIWLLLGIAVVQTLTFAYVIPYAGYTGTTEGPVSRGLTAMLPGQFVSGAIGGLPLFVGALALIFGVLVAGGEYGWETWKTVLSQRPSRVRVYSAKLVTVAAGTAILVLALLAFSASASVVVAALADQPMTWPSIVDIVRGFGAGWLVTMMWGALGMALGIVFRGVALPIGLGLVWMLAIQNLLSSIAAPLLDWVNEVQKGLPGPNAGALVASLIGTGPPGVDPIVGGTQAGVVIVAYLVAFAVLGGWLLRRRDID